MYIPIQKKLFQRKRKHRHLHLGWLLPIFVVLLSITSVIPAAAQSPAVTIVAPDDGAILAGTVTLQANVSNATVTGVEFFYDPHEDDAPATSLGPATFNSSTGFWELVWNTRSVSDTYNIIDTDGDGIEDTTVNLTKPPTSDRLSVVATTSGGNLSHAIDIRIQNMLTSRIFLPDNQEDLRGFEDLEALVIGEYAITSVRFDVYDISAADPAILTPFGEFQSLGEPIENRHYGRPLGAPLFPAGSPIHSIGKAVSEGSRRWVFRGWDTTAIPDGTYLLVATAEDAGDPDEGVAPRRATYMVETYIVNDLRVVITAPADGAAVSRFVALEARTSSLTGADNAAPGSLWPATSVVFDIDGTSIPASEIPSGSGRWRAIWDGDSFTPGPYTITATATNANPNGPEIAVDSINVTLVAPGAELEAFFPFDWSNCNLYECSFLDGSSGGPNWWLWDFGDGNTSTDQLPTHTYTDYGVYTVSLTVSNDGGTTTDTYTRVIPVGNTGVVSFNRNALDDGETLFIDWTSAFKNFNYEVGSTLAIPVMWKTPVGSTQFNSMPTTVCDADEDTSNQECVIFTPEEAFGTAPTVVGVAEEGVLFSMEFTDVQYRGVTDIFKGKANVRVVVDVDLDGNGSFDQQNQLGTNVDVTNSGVEGDETRLVTLITPFEGQFVGGTVGVSAGVVSSVTADQVEFFVNGASVGVDVDGSNGWSTSWNTTTFADGPYALSAVASFGSETTTSAVVNVTVENALPPGEPPAPDGTFQIGRANDTLDQFITYPFELEEEGGGPPGGWQPTIDASMTAEFTNITVIPGGGVIGGDLLEFDVVITNSSDPASGAILTAFAFQSKFSESPALASRIGDKLFYAYAIDGTDEANGPMGNVKKNGTSNGLFSGRWKGICINSSIDFLPEFNAGLNDETLECAGTRADLNADGEPELLTAPLRGLAPGESQTVRLRLDSGTTDGALHVVEPGTLRGRVEGTSVTGPNGIEYFVPTINNTGITDPNVLSIPDFADNKVLRDADGTFNPTFAPLADGLTFDNQIYLTLPRRNFAFTDILGRNHTCGSYGLDLISGIPCSGNPNASPVFGFLDTGDLVPGVQNFAALLHGFGEYVETGDPNDPYAAPNYPYGVPCVNLGTPDGLRCGARPFTPIAEFYANNPDGTVTRQMVSGSYGALGSADQYKASIASASAADVKEEVIPELDPGGPCDPIADPDSRRPSCAQLRTSATGHFYGLTVLERAGINGGDVVEFNIDITNTSANPNAYLTAFNYQTKQRSLADIGTLDGFTQDRRDVRSDSSLPPCTGLDDGACYNAALGIAHFPNVIGNGLLFGQMVWQSGRIDRAGQEIIPDFVAVDPVNGIDPVPYKLESVKKNGPFAPILKGNVNFICVKSGLFFPDQDADASCAGVPAILIDPAGEPVPSNISQRLGLSPGETQSVRIRMEFGDFRGAMLQVIAGTLTADNIHPAHTATGGLARFFDCEDQRELEFCHPHLVGENINYLPNTDATWLTPETLEEIEYVIINQPGDAPRIMNFRENFGVIMKMAGFIPSAEFYAPDPNPDLVGTPYEGVLIRQQVLGTYEIEDPLPPPELLASFTAECTDLACDFDGTSSSPLADIVSFDWNFGDGLGDYLDQPAQVNYPYESAGTYFVTLTVTNEAGATASVTNPVTVEAPNQPPLASFTFSCTDLTCSFDGSDSSDADGTIVSYDWDFGDGAAGTGVNPDHSYAAGGTYTVMLTVTDDDAAAGSDSQAVTVQEGNQSPLASFTVTCTDLACSFDGSDSSDADGIIVSYDWDFGDGAAGTGVNPDHSYAAGGTYTVMLTVTDDDDAAGSTSQAVTVEAPNLPPLALFTITCVELTCEFKGSDAYDPDGVIVSYAWGFGDGAASSHTTVQHTFAASGDYLATFEVTDDDGATASASQMVTVTEAPQEAPLITSTPQTAGSAGDLYTYQVTATGYPAPTFSLDSAPAGMTIGSASGLIQWVPGEPGTYEVTVRAANGVDPADTQTFQIVVEGEAALPYQLVYSTHPNRTNPATLSGATVRGKIFVFLLPPDNISRVRFWLDGQPKNDDRSAPFDLIGNNGNRGQPLLTDRMSNGEHTVTAEITFSDGTTETISATFTSNN